MPCRRRRRHRGHPRPPPRARPGRGLQPGRGQLGREVLGPARAHRPGQRPRRGRAARIGPPAPGADRPRGAVRPGVQRGDLRPPRPVTSGRGHPGPPGEPVRRRQGVRAPHGRRLPAPRPARREPDPLQPRVAAPARAVRHPQDHRRGRRDLRRHRLPAHPRQPRRGARLGLGPRLRRRDGARRPRRRPPRLRGRHRREPLGRGVRRHGVPLRRHRRLVVVRRRRPGALPPGRRAGPHRRPHPDPDRPRVGADRRLRGRRTPDGRRRPGPAHLRFADFDLSSSVAGWCRPSDHPV